ncbi:MAG TPA: ANTAR domain-containing protein [Acidimicrobiales bacterium]|nr:ANTAR domain-containing protein [Acidimicrobiales bacterium]
MLQEEAFGDTGDPLLDGDRVTAEAFACLQKRLLSMPVIEQAKGIIMATNHCTPDEAFDILRRASQRTNVKVRVIAEQIVERTISNGKCSEPAAGVDGGSRAHQTRGMVPGEQREG